MDDNNLRYELESRGQSIGPIVDSTRELYRRLLKRLMDEELDQLIGGQQEPIDADDDTEEEDEEEELDIHSVNSGAKTAIEPKSSFRSKIVLFLLTLFLCIVFAYYVKQR